MNKKLFKKLEKLVNAAVKDGLECIVIFDDGQNTFSLMSEDMESNKARLRDVLSELGDMTPKPDNHILYH